MKVQRLGSVLVLAALAACAQEPTAVPRGGTGVTASVSGVPSVAGRFIVTVADRVNPAQVARAYGVVPDFVYTHAINGFAGAMSDAAREGLLRDARVVMVEPDGIAEAWTTQSPVPSWGLDRIDQRSLPLSGTFSSTNDGTGVTAYIIDTGIWISHGDFGTRASVGYDAIGDGQTGIDCNGHGTHVAGTVGGTTYGVAKNVSLVAVRVLSCGGSGTWSGVIAGLDWVTANRRLPAVANMSLGGGTNTSVDNAVKRMITAGVATAVAAGNGNTAGIAADACKYSPARVTTAMTIGATNSSDTKASWSNYGKCVDWFAPGVGITSAWLNGGTNTISGTSMATPHTTGVAALYLQSNPAASPATVASALAADATRGVVKSAGSGSPNLLLWTSY